MFEAYFYLLVSKEISRFFKVLFSVDNFNKVILGSAECIRNGFAHCPENIKNQAFLLYQCVIKIVLIFTAAAGAGV